MVNVFPGAVEGADPEGRRLADEGKVYALVDAIPLIPGMLR